MHTSAKPLCGNGFWTARTSLSTHRFADPALQVSGCARLMGRVQVWPIAYSMMTPSTTALDAVLLRPQQPQAVQDDQERRAHISRYRGPKRCLTHERERHKDGLHAERGEDVLPNDGERPLGMVD